MPDKSEMEPIAEKNTNMSKPLPISKESIQETIDALIAWRDGKPWQFRYNITGWFNASLSNNALSCLGAGAEIRPAPQPEPWTKMEHVPQPCWIRMKGSLDCAALIVGFTPSELVSIENRYGWEKLKSFEHSTDRINWKPCIVE